MDPALWELLSGEEADREVAAIIRLREVDQAVPGVRLVARFGRIATCRLRTASIVDVRGHPNVVSLKAPRKLDADHVDVPPADTDASIPRDLRPTDSRKAREGSLTGAGVVVGVVDWGLDFDHPNFKHADGTTRLLALWDQRDIASGDPPRPYGYGTVHSRNQINRALRTAQPYISLGYHPGSSDRGGGSHGTHVADIAVGNGSAGGPPGVAPDAHLVFVHLADRNTGGLANLGDSVRLLEAVDFIARMAEPRPWVINLSIGRHGGPHDGTTLAELAFDELLRAAPGRFIVQSTGNYYRSRTHASGKLMSGRPYTLTFVTSPADTTANELEIWYDGDDEFVVHIQPPGSQAAISVPLHHHARVMAGDQIAGRIYHRAGDPNNNDNHIDAFLYPQGRAGRWTVTLEAVRLVNGRFHAWLERDEECKQCQARFASDDSDPTSTTGTIANSQLPLVVGAYDGHSPSREVAAFSSSGPTRDARIKPDLVAPGVDVLAARSAAPGSPRSSGQLVRKSGSSMAAPHVTGAAALCLQAGGHRIRAEQLRALVLATAQPAATTEDALRLGGGYLDLAELVTGALRRFPGQIPYDRTKGTPMDTELDPIARLALAPSRAYRELMYNPQGATAQWIADRFDIVARPGQQIMDRSRRGDVLLKVSLGHPNTGACAVIDHPDTDQRRMAPGQLILRRRHANRGAPPRIEHDFGDETDAETRTPVVVDPAAAVSAFEMVERSRVAEPLLTPRESASAVEWTTRVHPAISGVTVDEIRTALASYTDAPAVQSAIQARNQHDPGHAIDASSSTTDAVLVECVHQFQMKCYLERREHDGRAGESTLDSLGLIARHGSGLRTADRGNATAQQRLNSRDTQLRAASAQEFTAADWFNLMTDPSVFGLRTKGGRGLHLALVRKLRQAERHLLTLPAFRGMTPAALGTALGLSEKHGGARPTAATTSVHTFGLAIDIGYQRNPWVRRAESWRAMQRAASLISGVNLTHASAPAYFSSLGSDPSRSTGEIWDELQQRNAELIAYFGFAADPQALRAALEAGQGRGTPGLINEGESLHAAVVRWQRDIRQDRRALTAGDFNGRQPERGFLTHPRDLAIALRDHGCLAWGAVDLGPGDRGSGDMMHYDARVDGVGRVLTQGTRAFLPTTGHPCPSLASTRPAEEARSDAEATLEHVQPAAPGLLEHCAGCADAEEASTLVHTCRTGEGPPAGEPNPRGKGPHPTIRRGTTPAQSRRPSVGWAQLSLNRWIEQHTAGTHQCPATSAEAQQYVRRQLDALRAESQLPLAVDCRFGPSTQRAVRAFQACMGIGRDGIVGPVTWPLLKRFEGPTGPPVQPTVTTYVLLVDADRNGSPTAAAPDRWTWGASGRGAVILANNDDDGSRAQPDNEDERVNSGNDSRDVAPLIIQRSGPAPSSGATLELRVDDHNNIRIFDGQGAGAREIIGPSRGASHRFPSLARQRFELAMEATRYPTSGFDGQVRISLQFTDGSTSSTAATVRVAPWMMASHLARAERVFVAAPRRSPRVSEDSRRLLEQFRAALEPLVRAAGCRLVAVSTDHLDVWMQDCMEFGQAALPGNPLRTVLRSPQVRRLGPVARSMLAADLGFTDTGGRPGTTFDSFGNLEVSPAVISAAGKQYPFGRIYFGPGRTPAESMDARLRNFLAAQVVQEPFEVDTSWLAVGHVDEIVCFVPDPSSSKGFKMLLASTRAAYAILDGIRRTAPSARLLSQRTFPIWSQPDAGGNPTPLAVEQSVDSFLRLNADFHPDTQDTLASRVPPPALGTLRDFNSARQADLDRVRQTMERELGLSAADIIEIPSVFMPNPEHPDRVSDALIAGIVNMVVINQHCIVPKPFGPVVSGVDAFEKDVFDKLRPLGLTVNFLDCWDTYHVYQGEVHCATNTLREAAMLRWWETRP